MFAIILYPRKGLAHDRTLSIDKQIAEVDSEIDRRVYELSPEGDDI